eukprot:6176040-Pleurochrysis_carterae.AAC.3
MNCPDGNNNSRIEGITNALRLVRLCISFQHGVRDHSAFVPASDWSARDVCRDLPHAAWRSSARAAGAVLVVQRGESVGADDAVDFFKLGEGLGRAHAVATLRAVVLPQQRRGNVGAAVLAVGDRLEKFAQFVTRAWEGGGGGRRHQQRLDQLEQDVAGRVQLGQEELSNADVPLSGAALHDELVEHSPAVCRRVCSPPPSARVHAVSGDLKAVVERELTGQLVITVEAVCRDQRLKVGGQLLLDRV